MTLLPVARAAPASHTVEAVRGAQLEDVARLCFLDEEIHQPTGSRSDREQKLVDVFGELGPRVPPASASSRGPRAARTGAKPLR